MRGQRTNDGVDGAHPDPMGYRGRGYGVGGGAGRGGGGGGARRGGGDGIGAWLGEEAMAAALGWAREEIEERERGGKSLVSFRFSPLG